MRTKAAWWCFFRGRYLAPVNYFFGHVSSEENGFQGYDFNFVPIRVVKIINIGPVHFFSLLRVVTFPFGRTWVFKWCCGVAESKKHGL